MRQRRDLLVSGHEVEAVEAVQAGSLREHPDSLSSTRRIYRGTDGPPHAAHPGDQWGKHLVAQLDSVEFTLDLVAGS